jgi:hypothetical protein
MSVPFLRLLLVGSAGRRRFGSGRPPPEPADDPLPKGQSSGSALPDRFSGAAPRWPWWLLVTPPFWAQP